MTAASASVSSLLKEDRDTLLQAWVGELEQASGALRGRVSSGELAARAREFIEILARDVSTSADGSGSQFDNAAVDRFFDEFARDRVAQGFNSEETATFVFSLKRPLFTRMRETFGHDPQLLADRIWDATLLLDRMGLRSIGAFQRMREDVIGRQQQELLELSTPVVKLWDGVLALPIVGTLDSARTQLVMESLLTRIADTEASIAIVDITGVPTVDTLVAQHLIKTVTAIRLMGAECIVSGVRPQIAQTIVHLGVDLGGVTTKATLADALALALKRTGVTFSRAQAG